ncbi:uncharacterized protein LOC115445926 [Manduca sexta]|uniref:Uncharacterized protein n=1 Tax=Manduca sexta TaxID=7130 RepID=A0A922CC94_MANSE|nr:uncharacterized protein LOC115445926 [Manduca sexta]KAG6440313.1 hypothetical protein O3G_MSEX001239 [Manduca sexta]
MCHSGVFLTGLLLLLQTNGESTEEQQAFFPPSTVNFHDIYSNSLALLADEPSATATGKEEDFHISNMPSQFVEFRPPQTTILPSTTTVEISTGTGSTERSESSSAPTLATTEEPEEISVKVLPIAKNYQRGVLDLLFPATRVRSFKSIFDSFKRILSHTFRR